MSENTSTVKPGFYYPYTEEEYQRAQVNSTSDDYESLRSTVPKVFQNFYYAMRQDVEFITDELLKIVDICGRQFEERMNWAV